MAFVITRTSPGGERIIASGIPQDEIQASIVDEAVQARLGREIWPDTPCEEHDDPIRVLTAFSHIDVPPFPRTEEIIPGHRHTVRELPADAIAAAITDGSIAQALNGFQAAERELEERSAISGNSASELVVGVLRRAREPLIDLEERLRTRADGPSEDASREISAAAISNADRLSKARLSLVVNRSSVSWGYVDLTYSETLISSAETPTLLFALIALDKSHKGHGLVRENHHSGYHFHYVHASKRRSDVLLTFGTSPPDPQYPVTWERHGEGHAVFSPDVFGWGARKRESLNLVCCANAAKLGRTAFRHAGREAEFLLPV